MCKFPRLFALLLVALMAGSAFAATTITAVDSAAPIGKTGHTIDVTLVQNDGTLSNFQVDFSYDTSVLEITGATLQSGGAYTVFANQASGPSSYLFAASDFTGTGVPAGTQIQVSFTANVKGDATAGVSAITLTTGDNGSKGPDGAAGAVLNNGTFEALSFGLTTDAVGTLATTEAGAEATFDVTLNTEPTADVFVTVGSSDATEGTVSPTVLSFTTANWNVGQPVTVTGAEDELDDGDKAYEIFFIFDSSDTDYDTETNPDVASAPVAASNADDDTSAVLVAPAGSPSEFGGQATLSVQLDAQPTDTVTITLSSDNPAEGVVTTPATKVLTFTTTDYNVAQTVIVTGINDDRDDGDTAFNIDFALTGNDAQYTALTPATQLTNIDDDDAGINATVSDSSTTEAGGNGSASISLKSEPFADVVFTFSSDDPTEGSVSNTTLTFTAVNWDQNQLVTVVGVNDDVADGSVPYTLNVSIASNDGAYTALSFPTLGFANEDDDVAGIAVTLNQLTIAEDGGQDTFDVTLTSEPTGDVRVLVNSNSPLDATVNPAELTFTSENWDQGVPVTVTGVNDDIDRDDSATVALTVDNVNTADSIYAALDTPANVSITLMNEDEAGVKTIVANTQTSEYETSVTFDVLLETEPEPTKNVQLDFSSTVISEGTITSNATVTFTSSNWDTPQTVTVTGADDLQLDGNQTYKIDYSVSGTAPAYSQDLNGSIDFENLDNEAARFELSLGAPRADFTQTAGSPVFLHVTAFDLNNNPANYTGLQNLMFGGVDSSPDEFSPTIDDTDVGQTTSVAFSSGQADITGVFPNAANDFTLTVSDADNAEITQGSITGTSTAAADNQLSFSAQPTSNATARDPGSVQVSILDAFGNPKASIETVELQLVERGTTTDAAFTGVRSKPAVDGTAAFNDLLVTDDGVFEFLATSSTAPGLSQARSNAFSIGDPPPDLTAVTPNTGAATTPQAQNIDEGEGASLTFTATFDDSDRDGQPTGEGQISTVAWEVRLGGNVVETITDTPAGPPNQHTSTFTFDAGFDRLSSGDGSHNDEETFQITATGSDQNTGTTTSAWDVTVRDTNRPPSVDGVTLAVQVGSDALATSTFVATPGSASDPDNDPVTYTYEWLVNGAVVAGQTTSTLSNNGGSNFIKGQIVAVRITPTNSGRNNPDGTAVTSSTITVQNSDPNVAGAQPAADDNETIEVDLSIGSNDDDDGDSLTYSIVSGPTQGIASITGTMLSYTADSPQLATAAQGNDTIVFRANDGEANSGTGVLDITVTGVNDAPVSAAINAGVQANEVNTNPRNIVQLEIQAEDPDDDRSALSFRLLTEPSSKGQVAGTLTSGGAALTANSTFFLDASLSFDPADAFRGLAEFTFEIFDDEGASTSSVLTGKITVGTPPWFRYIDLTDYDTDPKDFFYQVVIKDEAGTDLVRTSIDRKTAVEPIDYLNAGSEGLRPGDYLLSISKFEDPDFNLIVEGSPLVVDDYNDATANLDVSNPQEVNGNQVFSFNLENAAGYNFVLTQPDGTVITIRETFRPDNNGVIPLNGSFSKSLFLSQSGTYHLSVSGFNPKGDGLPVTSTFQLDEPAGPTDVPSRIDISTMTPGTESPDDPQIAATASVQDGDVANVTFSWGPASGASDYFVFISTRGRQIIENISPAPSGQTTFGPVPLVPGDYFWHAVAKNGEGFSVDWSEPAYFSVARDPSSTAPFIAELEMPNENGDVEFTVATLIGDFVDLLVYQATNPSIEFRDRSVAVSEFPFTREFPFTLNDDRFNIPNETYVFQAQPYNADGSRGLWTAANQYTVPDNGGTALGIPTEAQLLEDWPKPVLTVRNAASLQFQLRAFHPDPDDPDYLTFSPDDTRLAPIRPPTPNGETFTVPITYRNPGLRTYIRARAVTANGSFGPWSPWAVHINP